MMFGRGYNGINGCFGGFGFMHNGMGMFLFFILIVVIVVAVILLLNKYRKHQSNDTAMDELKLMFVKGEILEEEYLKRKKLIER